MRELRNTILLSASLVVLLVLLVFTSIYSIRVTAPAASDEAAAPEEKHTAPKETTPGKQGLVTENGSICFYDGGSLFTGGYKEISDGETTDYYYFLPNGQAFTSGYKALEINGTPCYFFFEEDS